MFKKLRRHGREPVDLPYSRDGNCLFHAVAYSLDNEVTHRELRRAVCAVMSSEKFRKDNEAFLPENWDEHVQEMQKEGCWGDAYALLALAWILHRRVTVFFGKFHQTFYPRKLAEKTRLILAFEGDHYFPTRHQ